MVRAFLSLTLISLIAASVPAREAASFRAGAQPDAKKPAAPPEDRGKIVEEIKADLGLAVEKLNQNDPGAQTRKAQRRILDNIDKLLRQDDNPPPNSRPPSSDPPKPMNPPSSSEKPQPIGEAKPQQPVPSPEKAPVTPMKEAHPAEVEVNQSLRDLPPRTLQELQKAAKGEWRLPYRSLPEMDVVSRDRFVPRYENLIREYFRSLAESGRRDGIE